MINTGKEQSFKPEWVQGMKSIQQSSSHRQVKLYYQQFKKDEGYRNCECDEVDIDNQPLLDERTARIEEQIRCLKNQKTPRLIKQQAQAANSGQVTIHPAPNSAPNNMQVYSLLKQNFQDDSPSKIFQML